MKSKARRSNPDSEHHIKRIDSSKKSAKPSHGFQVHFSREGRLWTKFFSDSVHGGKEGARRAARKFRNALEKTVPAARDTLPIREGANGYTLRVRKNRNGTVTRYISASAPIEKGVALKKAFRVQGDDLASAIKLALDWRVAVAKKRLRAEA